jgi:hypothetical protein
MISTLGWNSMARDARRMRISWCLDRLLKRGTERSASRCSDLIQRSPAQLTTITRRNIRAGTNHDVAALAARNEAVTPHQVVKSVTPNDGREAGRDAFLRRTRTITSWAGRLLG